MNEYITPDRLDLIWGGLGFLLFSYALGRALRGLKHGYSIRLQLFFTLFSTSMLITTLIGWWAINRVEARAALLFEESGLSTEMIEHFLKDFGLKTSVILGLLTLIAAGGAWALGRGLALPIELFSKAAENVALGGDIASLPTPPGKELRDLRESLVSMHEALEDRRKFEDFIAELSHDLKNPVAAIKASVEVLRLGAIEEEESRTLFLMRIDEASARLNLLLSDFLGLARLEARGIRFDQKPISPFRAFQAALKSLEGVASLKELTVIHSFNDLKQDEIFMKGSHRWLVRAFENMVSNAIKFAPNQSKIWIDWSLTQHQKLHLLVSDEGQGVPNEIKADLFNRFVSRVPDQQKAESTGLGLAIVKRVIEAHYGTVQLYEFNYSEDRYRVTQGAQFLIELPLLKPKNMNSMS